MQFGMGKKRKAVDVLTSRKPREGMLSLRYAEEVRVSSRTPGPLFPPTLLKPSATCHTVLLEELQGPPAPATSHSPLCLARGGGREG